MVSTISEAGIKGNYCTFAEGLQEMIIKIIEITEVIFKASELSHEFTLRRFNVIVQYVE